MSGQCAGWHESPETITLCAALAVEIDGTAPWIQVVLARFFEAASITGRAMSVKRSTVSATD